MKNILILIKLYGKIWIALTIFITIILGITPYFNILITQLLTDEIVVFLADNNEQLNNNTKLYYLLILLFLANFSPFILNSLLNLINLKQEYIYNYLLTNKVSIKSSNSPISYFDNPDFHHKLDRIKGPLGAKFMKPIEATFGIAQYSIGLISILYFLSNVDFLLTLLCLLIIVPIVINQIKFGKRNYNLMIEQTPENRKNNYISSLLIDRLHIKEIRVYGLANHFLKQWKEKYLQLNKEKYLLFRKQTLSALGIQAIGAMIYIVCILLVVNILKNNSSTIGTYVAITQSLLLAQTNIRMLTSEINKFYSGHFFYKDLFGFLHYSEKNAEVFSKEDKIEKIVQQEGIKFSNVNLKYPYSNTMALDNVSFNIRPGEKVAIVGRNGSGKSSIVKCLLGLYKTTSGVVSLDGRKIQNYDSIDYYKKFSVVFQDYIKYNLTAYENIALGDIDNFNNKSNVYAATTKLGIHNKIISFNEGYNTVLGKIFVRGEDLSGGQWQSLALSRAFLRDKSILIFDEPTSSLDPITELKMYEEIIKLSENRTTVFISHRMASAKLADRIFVMKEGKLIETGTHEELINGDTEYSTMYNAQAKWYDKKP
ncbi:ABC transporter ATP-binding protein [Sutcliffiella horikoshii]|uniref:ABC transporter ATP-binding protein n=1 Tax=Sutcliffiella horikoshii TaxID=79883 RepID=UPI003850DE50